MPIVNIEYSDLKALEQRAMRAEKKVRDLKDELSKAREDYEALALNNTDKNRVICIEKLVSPFYKFGSLGQKTTLKNFDDVKDFVEGMYKDGIFTEEIQKEKKLLHERMDERLKEAEDKNIELLKELNRVNSRNILQRIINK